MDEETQKIMTDAEEIRSLIESKGWKLVRSKLDERILDLQNINNIDTASIDTIATQIAARKMASELVFAWLKMDVEGAVEARDTNITHPDMKDDGYLDRG